jgi:hypothetical protein
MDWGESVAGCVKRLTSRSRARKVASGGWRHQAPGPDGFWLTP